MSNHLAENKTLKPNIRKIFISQQGIALLLTLFILSGALVVVLSAAEIVYAGLKMNRISNNSGVAFFAAEAGMEEALWQARQNSTLGDIAETPLTNGSTYTVSYTTDGTSFTFKSIGLFRGVKRSVEAVY